MDRINYRDLFDFNDATEVDKALKAIASMEQEYTQLSKTLGEELNRMKAAMSSLSDGLRENEALLKRINITASEQQKKILGIAADVEKQAQAYQDLEKSQKGVTASQKIDDDSLDGIKKKLKDLTTEFSAVNKTQQPERWRQLATAINETQVEANQMKMAAKGMTHQMQVAQGSYKALQLQTNALSEELRSMAGGMESTTGRAEQLKTQIFANTQRLKEFDKQINQSFRNVGNYAESIIAAKEQLDRNRASLLSQISALKQQAAANASNIDVQNKIQAELKKTNTELYSVNKQLGSFKTSSDIATDTANKFADRMKRIGIESLGAYVGFQALKSGLMGVVTLNSELSDAQADVMKTTQLSKEAVNDLTESFIKLDTRTALNDLLSIATVGGQLGVAASDVEGFTNAIDKAAVALKDEFAGGAEEIATAMAKINNVYGASKDVGLEAGLTNIASAINEVGAKGAATSPFLTDFALRVGAVASNAGLGLDKVLGYAAALEELGFTSEVAAGALKRVLSGMAANSDKFYSIAKMGDANLELKEFEHLINTDINQALNVFIKGLNAGGDKTTTFSRLIKDLKLDGDGASSVLTSLAKKTELVADRQRIATEQMKEGTSVLNEFNTKNNNLAGSLDKLKKGFQSLFVSGEIQSALKALVDGVLVFLGVLRMLYKGVKDNKDIIAAAIPIMVGFRTATYTATVAQSGWLASLGLTRIAMLRNIVTMRAWFATMMANPIGLIVLGIAALVIGFNRLEKTSERNLALEKKANDLHDHTEQALKKVSEAQREINNQIENYTKLSPAEQQALKERIVKEKQLAIAILERLEAERKTLVNKAAEINTFDKVKAMLFSMGQAHLFVANLVEGQAERMTAASRSSADEIARLKDSIKNFDLELVKIGATAEEIAKKQAEDGAKQAKAESELHKFRLEQQAKALEYFANQQQKESDRLAKYFEDGTLSAQEYGAKVAGVTAQINNAQREASITRIRVAAIERDMLLANEDLLGAERTKIIEEYAAKAKEIQQKLAEDLKIEELMPVNAVGKFLKDREAEDAEAMKAAEARMKKHLKEMQDAWAESEEARTRKMQEEQERRDAIRQAGEELAWAAWDAAWEIGRNRNEAEIQELEQRKERELAITGDNADAKKIIEEQYQKEIAEKRIKQAKADKLMALFEVGINTAVAIAKAVAQSPVTFGLPWSGFALAMGAIQAAAIASKPLPQYYKGRQGGPAEFAIVDEKGPEIIERRGQMYIGQNEGPRLTYLQSGDKVYPALDTEKLLADILNNEGGANYLGSMQKTNTGLSGALKPDTDSRNSSPFKMGRYFKSLEKTIKSKQEVRINVTKQGIETMVKKGESWVKYANDRYNNL